LIAVLGCNELDVPFIVLYKGYELAKNPCDVSPIYLIDDDQDISTVVTIGCFYRLK